MVARRIVCIKYLTTKRERRDLILFPPSPLSFCTTTHQPVLCLIAVFSWCHLFVFEKAAVEVGDVVVANVIADTGDLSVGRRQQFTGLADPDSGQELIDGIACGFAEKTGKIALIHPHQFG